MTLREAKLCMDCEEVFKGAGACPRCGSPVTVYLRGWVVPLSDLKSPPPGRIARSPLFGGAHE